jgi:hypothetical protein
MGRPVWVIGGVGISVVVVILGAVLAWWLGVFDGDEDAAGAEEAVREYLELIEDGQAEQATRMVPLAQTRLDGNDEFLTDEVLDAADERIAVGDVRTTWSHENKATVSAEYRLGDENVRIKVRTEYVGDTWKLLDTLAERVLIRTNMPTLDHAKIGDIEVPVTTNPCWTTNPRRSCSTPASTRSAGPMWSTCRGWPTRWPCSTRTCTRTSNRWKLR